MSETPRNPMPQSPEVSAALPDRPDTRTCDTCSNSHLREVCVDLDDYDALRRAAEGLQRELKLLKMAQPPIDRDEKIRAMEDAIKQHFDRAEQLQKEVERVNALHKGLMAEADKRVEQAESRASKAEAELQAMRADAPNARRYQWAQNNWYRALDLVNMHYDRHLATWARKVSAAIDAARSQQERSK